CSAVSLTLGARIGVAPQGFAEASVGFLDGAQPAHRALTKFFCSKRNSFESAQRAARAVNIVEAPAPAPGAVFALIFEQKLYGALNGGLFGAPAKTAQAFDDTSRHISGGRIDHGVVIGKRNVTQEFAVVVAIKRAPAAVFILHAQQPLDPKPHGSFHALRVGMFYALQRHQDERGVVDVREEIVAK